MKKSMSLFQIYKNNKLKIWILCLLAIPAMLIVGLLFLPELFWERFLWRYLWGPVVADAEGRTVDGISAGYNPVNTAVYATILIISFFGIYELFKFFEIEFDRKFVYSLIPWVILGGSLRSLEDVGIFKEPLDRVMITPIIYILLGFFAFLLLLGEVFISRSKLKEKNPTAMRLILLLPIPLIYLSLQGLLADFFIGFLVIIFAGILFSFLISLKFFDMNEKYILFSYGTTLLFLALSYNAYYILLRPEARLVEAILIPTLGLGMTFLFLGVSWFLGRFFKEKNSFGHFLLFLLPLNILIVWGHLFDAVATYRGIAAYGYVEKHVLPNLLIEVTGTPLVMFPLKIVLIFFVVYILDVALKKEFSDEKTLLVFLKFLIIMVGAAPAVRNTLRIAMGV